MHRRKVEQVIFQKLTDKYLVQFAWIHCHITKVSQHQNIPDPCSIQPCGANAVCQAVAGNAVCLCVEGFTGNPLASCCKLDQFMHVRIFHNCPFDLDPVDVCGTVVCGPNSICINEGTCQCKAGFVPTYRDNGCVKPETPVISLCAPGPCGPYVS